MKAEFVSYLDSVGLSSDTVKNNVESIYQYASILCPEEIADIFVCDFIKDDGSREYESLWFFSPNYMMEVRNFRSDRQYDIDLARSKGWIAYYRTYAKDYDFKRASSESRMTIEALNNDTVNMEWKASRDNCDKLKSILENYLKPNI